MSSLFDTHCHLNHESFSDDLANVLKRAVSANVTGFICPGYDLKSSFDAVDIANRYPHVKAAIGIHPHDADKLDLKAESDLRELAADRTNVVAIGETGLDYYRSLTPVDAQHSAFRFHIRLAHETDLPLVIHSRDAGPDVINILLSEGIPRRGVIMHCMSEDGDFARRSVEIGCFIGFAGNITFKNADGLRQIAAELPADKILLETDCPYLAPVPYRGKRNEPSYLPYIAEKLADIKHISLNEITEITDNNVDRLFSR